MYAVLDEMKNDYILNHKCNFAMANKKEETLPASWPFPKNSPYKQDFAKGYNNCTTFMA